MNSSLSGDSYVCVKTCAWFQPDITASSEDLAVICWITFTMYCLHIPLTWVAPDYACKENPVNHDNKGEVCRVLLWLSKDFTSNIARNLPFPPPKSGLMLLLQAVAGSTEALDVATGLLQAARDQCCLAVSIVVLPFHFEGQRRRKEVGPL